MLDVVDGMRTGETTLFIADAQWSVAEAHRERDTETHDADDEDVDDR